MKSPYQLRDPQLSYIIVTQWLFIIFFIFLFVFFHIFIYKISWWRRQLWQVLYVNRNANGLSKREQRATEKTLIIDNMYTKCNLMASRQWSSKVYYFRRVVKRWINRTYLYKAVTHEGERKGKREYVICRIRNGLFKLPDGTIISIRYNLNT